MAASTSYTATRPQLWRILNYTRDVTTIGKPCRVATVFNSQDGTTTDDLAELEDQGWATYLLPSELGDIEFRWADTYARSPLILLAATMALTPAAVIKLNHPFNRVLRHLQPHYNRPHATTQVREVRRACEVDDHTLTELAAAELIQSLDGLLELAEFRKLPARLPLRLTPKARTYMRVGVIEVSWGHYI
ncbi:hypothetical protein [Actinoplanes auranticolor]|uniref:Uncharacterized protein n=1 Tax=Actinoplanes auranticolor TaxID=47988 RepID=A0A919SU92_9ACTN|nr:hypothetical protein [Actinoplanes auranticolor]GIM78622.1 hypothetical protein Aau02nite_81770 [Actinoplanes auranticolor]